MHPEFWSDILKEKGNLGYLAADGSIISKSVIPHWNVIWSEGKG
jgi:hypothetical protein